MPCSTVHDDCLTLLQWLRRNRLGIRMEGPRPQFARTDGGEGGSHPSNVHDHVYAIGTINFTGVPRSPSTSSVQPLFAATVAFLCPKKTLRFIAQCLLVL